MCTWLAIETVDHFLRNDGEVFSCMMDMTKAFDMVQHSLLFRKLLDAKLSSIFIRLIMVMYYLQYANVRWNNLVSGVFPMRNGVKQGAVLSALLYCIYVNGLFRKLRSRRAGCWIGSTFLGILGYADVNFLLAPSRQALQEMLQPVKSMQESTIFSFQPTLIQQRAKQSVWLSSRNPEFSKRWSWMEMICLGSKMDFILGTRFRTILIAWRKILEWREPTTSTRITT